MAKQIMAVGCGLSWAVVPPQVVDGGGVNPAAKGGSSEPGVGPSLTEEGAEPGIIPSVRPR